MNSLHQLKANVIVLSAKTGNKHLLRAAYHINLLEALLGTRAHAGKITPSASPALPQMIEEAKGILNAEGVVKSRAATAHAQVIFTALNDALVHPSQKTDAKTEGEIKSAAMRLPVDESAEKKPDGDAADKTAATPAAGQKKSKNDTAKSKTTTKP